MAVGDLQSKIEEIKSIIAASSPGSGYLIVKMSIVDLLLAGITEDQAAMLHAHLTSSPPQTTGPELQAWLKASRRALGGISQRSLAIEVRARGVKVKGSDIGNLEAGQRLNHYSDEKIQRIVGKVLELRTGRLRAAKA